jgi:hypothetical protein
MNIDRNNLLDDSNIIIFMDKKRRTPIPNETSAEILFRSDRTCCVCRDSSKKVQIHHIDENPDNNDINNLAVLCLECHAETQMSGGFGRKLDSDQIRLYRDNWHKLVDEHRKTISAVSAKKLHLAALKGEEESIKVEASFCSYNWERGEPIPAYMFTAKNFGNKPIILSGLYIELPRGMKLFYAVPIYQGTLPHKLEPGDSHFIVWPISDLIGQIEGSEFKGLKETRAFFMDKLSNVYYSNPFSLV